VFLQEKKWGTRFLLETTGGGDMKKMDIRKKEGNEATRWETFFASGSVWAQEFESEIERVKTLRVVALEADGRSSNPPAHGISTYPP